jgi:hypothetical protein
MKQPAFLLGPNRDASTEAVVRGALKDTRQEFLGDLYTA